MISNMFIMGVLVVNMLLSVGILLRNSKNRENSLFAAFVALVDLWMASNYLENAPGFIGVGNTALFLRLDFALAVLALFAWLNFCDSFARMEPQRPIRKFMRGAAEGIALLLAILALFSSLIIRNIGFSEGIVSFQRGPLWILYAVVLIVFAASGLLFLFLGRHRSNREGHSIHVRQIDLILLGFFISVGNAIFINVLQGVYPISLNVSRLGIYGLTVLVALTAYAVARHRLFDLRLIIVRAVSFVFFMGVFTLAYSLIFMLLVHEMAGVIVGTELLLTFLILTMAASLTFQPIDAMVRKITNRIFFKGRYNSEELLAGLTRIMAETMELETLTKKLLSGLLGSMGIEKGAFLIVNSHKIIEVKTIGYKGNDLANPRLEELFHHPRHHEGFIFDELEDQKVKDLFSNLDISVFIPVLVDKAEVAILVLGQKSCGQAYYDNDINFLNIFASEAGLAIQNSLRYEQIKKMNEELEARVAERTSQLEATQKKELEKAREVARLKDEFVFLAAHELRTPITAIRGFLALAESGRKFPKEVRDNMDAISQASAQLSQLITDLLEVARSDHGTLALKVDKISLGPLIKSTIRELAMQAKERKISVSIEVEPRITGVCDPEKFKEILLNLVSNAIKYNKERGEVTIRGFRDPRTGEAVIQVGDTGYGIPEEKQKFIFQKFFRAQTKETENVTGTGLGLFICRMLIEKMGGIINFSSTPGKGTTFTFTLPSGRGAGISGEMRLKTPGTFSAPDVRV